MSGQVQTKRRPRLDLREIPARFSKFLAKQPVGVEIAFGTAVGVLQGGALGYVLGQLTKSSAQQMAGSAGNAGMAQMMVQMQGGSVWGQTRSLAALCGASGGLSIALKKWRKKDDIWNQMGSAAGGGAAFTIASGNTGVGAIVNTSLMLGLFTGAFYKFGEMFKSDLQESDFERGRYMLTTLGLSKYSKNLKRGRLTDNTIMLWNDTALQEVRIPPGPRLLILHHLSQFKAEAGKPSRQTTDYPGVAMPSAKH
ncbi:unnamed protein product [Ostreobium quekettii]|uniref:Mitochondrial inner membrane translocase subunit Tim17/Tim22/Tim23/peroxisomal protein PMP24 n=1 Tax=Ostreobium quekettii TaxID=121088 RepID=A0A8S1JDU6_9CHLO|nr:unnamed protein product [Ostreobium quekettii]